MYPWYGGYRADPVRRDRPNPMQYSYYSGMYMSAYYGPYLPCYYGPRPPHAPVVHGHISLPMQAEQAEQALKWYKMVYGAENISTTHDVKDSLDGDVYTIYTMRLGPWTRSYNAERDGRALVFDVESRVSVSATGEMCDVDIWIFVQNPDGFAARAVAGGATQVKKYDFDKRYYIRLKDPFGYFWCVGKASMIPPNLAY